MGTLSFPRLPGDGLASDEVELGYLMGAFGVRGEVRVFLHHPESELLSSATDVVLVAPDGVRRRGRLQVRSGAGKRILGRLDGLSDPETAQTLREWRIAVSKAALGPLDDDELWVGELEGSTVRVGDVDVGRVITVQTTEGPDVLVIAIGEEVVLVPLVKAFFRGFDREARLLSLSADALEEG